MDLLVAAAREQGTTVILVTHEPRVAAYADREVIVRDGRVTLVRAGSGDRHDPARAPPRPGRRPGGRRPPGHHRGRRGARRRPAAGHPGRHQRGQRAERPVRLAEHRRRVAGRTAPAVDRRPAVVAAPGATTSTARPSAGSTSPPPARTRRSRRACPRLPGPGEYYASPALGALLRSDPGRPARRPLPRARRSARSARRRCRPRTRCSSSSATPPTSSPHRPAPTQVTRIMSHDAEQLHRAAASAPTPPGWTCILSVVAAGAALPACSSSSAPRPGSPPPAGSSASPRCAWSARRPGRSR